MSTTESQILELGERWARAERQGDADALDALSADDFTLVGPVGFVLNKQQWLDRYRTDSGLAIESLVWDEVAVRDYGGTAVAIGVHTQRGEFSGRPVDGTFRATHIAVRRGADWVLAGMHLSPIGGPPPFAPREQ
jgi:ketosteroid isomerase-like protein